jgi:hypothetical protein
MNPIAEMKPLTGWSPAECPPLRRLDRTVVLLFLLGLLFYLPGVWWGTPLATAPDRIKPWGSDEIAPLGPIAELYNTFIGRQPPYNPQYPLLQYVVQAAAVAPYLLWLLITGQFSPGPSVYPYGFQDPVTALAVLTILARLVNVIMGAAVPVIAFFTAGLLWGRKAGLAAGLLVLLSYPMLYYSRTSNVDMGALFWTAWGIAVFVACLRKGLNTRRALFLGLTAALATAAKDASYAAFAGIALALVIREVRARNSSFRKQAAIGLGVFLAAYAVASGAVFNWDRYLTHVWFVTHGSPAGMYFTTPTGLSGYASLILNTAVHLGDALGLPAMVLSLAGVFAAVRKDRAALWLLTPALMLWLGVVLPVRFVLFRFVIVMAYLLALFAAFGWTALAHSRARFATYAGAVFLVLALGWSAVRAADLSYQMVRDSRYAAAAWFRLHARSGDRVGYYGDPQKLPRLEAGIVTLPMPGQTVPLPLPVDEHALPEFVVVVPVQPHEKDHEFTMPESIYRGLVDGSTGYRPVAALRTPSLFRKPVITFVNPTVQIFVREDHWTRAAARARSH